MFDEFTQQPQQTSQPAAAQKPASTTKSVPEFPELKCSTDRSPVRLICTKQDCGYDRIFLCSKCIIKEVEHIKSHQEFIIEYDDFVRYMHESSGLKTNVSEEAQKIVKQKNHNISHFNNHISQEQYQITQTVNKLNELYKDKCNELTKSLQEQLEEEKAIFTQNYDKFENEVHSDKEKDAEMPKFHEIKQEIGNLKELEQIESYMKTILRKKQNWKEASVALRTMGQRTEDFYRSLIETHQINPPSFAQGDSIVQYWTSGLNSLIEEVKRRANCFQNLYEASEGISIDINQIQELELLTVKMIKPETELKINFSGQKLSNEIATKAGNALQNIANLRHLTLDFSQSQIQEESLTTLLNSLKTLVNLQYVSFTCEGSKNKNVAAIALAGILPSFVNLRQLRLNFAFSDLHCQGAVKLAEAVSQLQELETLNVQFQYNGVKEEGAKAWGSALENLRKLEHLHLNFGGYSAQKNKIKDEGATSIVKGIKFATNLKSLHLDFGHTGLHNSFTLEFSLSVKELKHLSEINLQLYHNGLSEKGGKKIARSLTKLQGLNNISLNLNNNELKKDGVREVIDAFRRVDSVQKLTLYLRSVGLQKDDAKQFETDLTHGKLYESCELFL